MVLSTTKRTSSISSIVNQNQGGGSKKAGLVSSVGKDSWMSIYIKSCDPLNRNSCCTRQQLTLTANPNVCPSRPIGADVRFNYYKC